MKGVKRQVLGAVQDEAWAYTGWDGFEALVLDSEPFRWREALEEQQK